MDNIRMDLVEVGWGDVESSWEFGIEPSGSIKCWGNYGVSKQLGISRAVLSSM
jgi:hypothetical protein